ncbi:hypothetical protein HF324_27620 [Chitinophaga oryzae]|uniref:Uncharacterized protein n=1 Tax=Chitinophaga oryzae TaxID=2725414 RepID=A0AAE7DB14_9BACT|nr:hypothetical protein [Chitinophaga oryzae]QJB34894.1 hypothetical protein HF329_27760 [Chitinophaga oryzae]QJB41405.1 hypothetical protein HF324_27620 [Chitinophaga oryzae]
MRTTFFYNPFDRLTESMIQFSVIMGEKYWIVQRFEWPGVPSGKGFMVSRYSKKENALVHYQHLQVGEGKMLDVSEDAEKLKALLQPGSEYHVFINTFQRGDWKKRMHSKYKKQFVSYITKQTNTTPLQGPVQVNLYFEYGRLMAEIHASEKEPVKIPVDQILKT